MKFFVLLFLNFAFVAKHNDVIASKAFNARTNFAFPNQFLSNDDTQIKIDQLKPIDVTLDREIADNDLIPISDMVSQCLRRAGK
jgi:hypothetical protein